MKTLKYPQFTLVVNRKVHLKTNSYSEVTKEYAKQMKKLGPEGLKAISIVNWGAYRK